MRRVIFFFRVLCMASLMLLARSAIACFKYDEELVSITGKVVLRTFFGPPGFGESPEIDSKEQQAILVLDKPLCVNASEDEDAESNQKEITLVPLKDVSLSRFEGKNIIAKGMLFHAITGHHHTAVLMLLQEPPAQMK